MSQFFKKYEVLLFEKWEKFGYKSCRVVWSGNIRIESICLCRNGASFLKSKLNNSFSIHTRTYLSFPNMKNVLGVGRINVTKANNRNVSDGLENRKLTKKSYNNNIRLTNVKVWMSHHILWLILHHFFFFLSCRSRKWA